MGREGFGKEIERWLCLSKVSPLVLGVSFRCQCIHNIAALCGVQLDLL